MWWVDSQGSCQKVHVTSGTAACGAGDETEFKSITNYVNAHGGIAGRQVIPAIFHTEFAGITMAQGTQQACTYFTQDQPVSVVISQDSIPGESVKCFAQHHIVTVTADTYPHGNTDYQSLSPYLYAPDRPRPERWIQAYVDGLLAQHFFDGNVKVGLVRYDYPEYNAVVDSVLKPTLASHHVTVAQDAVITPPAGEASFGDLQNQLQTTVLKFKSAGVNRVLFITDVGTVDIFWYQIAQSQHFSPEYGLSSTEQMSVFIDQAPKGSFNGAAGVGWDPFYDVKAAQDPDHSPAADTCKQVMNNPQDVPAGRNNKCDSLMFLKAAYDNAAKMGDITAAGIQKAVASLGTSFQPAEVFSTNFGPGLYDGPSKYMDYTYDNGCNCFKYTGTLQDMPDAPVPGLS
jgi:hypothetical protein